MIESVLHIDNMIDYLTVMSLYRLTIFILSIANSLVCPEQLVCSYLRNSIFSN